MAFAVVTPILLWLSRAVAQQGFLSIDSGGSQPWVDPVTQIQWFADESFLSANSNSQATTLAQNVSRELKTLRFFPSASANNCYLLPVLGNQKYFFRASFLYANYDGKDHWPSFNVSYLGGGDTWTIPIVATSFLADEKKSLALIFSTQPDSTSICICLNADYDVPFVSALELRKLPSDFYVRTGYLHATKPLNLGENSTVTLRYPDDKYDREWYPENVPPPNSRAIFSNLNITTSDIYNQPPRKVMMSAYEGLDLSPFSYSIDLGTISSRLYVLLYFMDLRNTTTKDVREFAINVTLDAKVFSDKVTLPSQGFWNVITLRFNGGYFKPIDSAIFTITLAPTINSTLPAILNAIEIYKHYELLQTIPSPTPSTTGYSASPPASLQRKARPSSGDVIMKLNYMLILPHLFFWTTWFLK